jgi:two-component system, OmpR family, phosphate regulon sensor histidine kinase PhoR
VPESLRLERLWELTAEHSPVGMCLVNPDGVLLMANRALCTMLECDEQELLGQRYELLTHPDDRGRHERLFDETIAGARDSYRLTKRCLRSDGSVLWGDLSAAVLRGDGGETRCVIGQLIDVTPQRTHEEELAEALDAVTRQKQLSRAILDTVDVGLLLIDRFGHYEAFNRRHEDLLRLSFPGGHHGRSGQEGDVYAADGVTRLTAEDMPSTRAARGEEFDDYRIWIGADPLQRRALSVSARAVFDATGAFSGAAMAYNDITDLMRAIQSRDDFLASVSHELRTPLASVIGYLELLSDHGELSSEATRHIEVVQRNAGRLRYLVSDLLESAQHRAGPVELTREPVDLSAVVRDAMEAALPSARAAGVDLEGSLQSPLDAHVDPDRMRQVVDNLVSNAVKYTDAGGHVTVSLVRSGADAVLAVSDTGIGMNEDDLAQLFTAFFRSDRARERHAPGVGLGLGICEAIVAAHGGRIEVASAVGSGTTITALVPLG